MADWRETDFDAAAMEPYVDWFGFMAYDLHGVCEYRFQQRSSLPSLTPLGAGESDSKKKIVRGQAEASEIYTNIIPLAFAGLNFSKINFGMAIYGRGFKLRDPNCRSMDGSCYWDAGNEPGTCTSFSGVLSYDEIQEKVATAKRNGNAQPVLDPTTMMKSFTWGLNNEHWIGYDDEDTWEMKRDNLADKYGFGKWLYYPYMAHLVSRFRT